MPVTLNTPGSVPWTMWASEKPQDGQLIVAVQKGKNLDLEPAFYMETGRWPEDWGDGAEDIYMWMPMKGELLAMWKKAAELFPDPGQGGLVTGFKEGKAPPSIMMGMEHVVPLSSPLSQAPYVPSMKYQLQGLPFDHKVLAAYTHQSIPVFRVTLVGYTLSHKNTLHFDIKLLGMEDSASCEVPPALLHIPIEQIISGIKATSKLTKHPDDYLAIRAKVSLTVGAYQLGELAAQTYLPSGWGNYDAPELETYTFFVEKLPLIIVP